MTRPQIIRADSIDLQDQDAPSAQDHTRQPTQPAPLGAGPPAPHQAEALREVAAEIAEQHSTSPRVSTDWSDGNPNMQSYGEEDLVAGVSHALNGDADPNDHDALAVAQNGGLTGSSTDDTDMADGEGDDMMDDDDMMDKISSSPSIDDGGYSLPQLPQWPERSSSLSPQMPQWPVRTSSRWPVRSSSLSPAVPSLSPPVSRAMSALVSQSMRDASSSPFVETPDYYPLAFRLQSADQEVLQSGRKSHRHYQGEYHEPSTDFEELGPEDFESEDEDSMFVDIADARAPDPEPDEADSLVVQIADSRVPEVENEEANSLVVEIADARAPEPEPEEADSLVVDTPESRAQEIDRLRKSTSHEPGMYSDEDYDDTNDSYDFSQYYTDEGQFDYPMLEPDSVLYNEDSPSPSAKTLNWESYPSPPEREAPEPPEHRYQESPTRGLPLATIEEEEESIQSIQHIFIKRLGLGSIEEEDESDKAPHESSPGSHCGHDNDNDDVSRISILTTFDSNLSRFLDSGWGGECLQDVEDIDFEFVYALHTFVATVEGQANATKGDTMVLLDDSNSYWWLVRVVKDSSIGYLPAEHIETPTERLARLNKHRNIDLAQSMLGDQESKSKNPLKKAMRRRNAKTVAFAPPTFVEASDNDYSSSEDEGDMDMMGQAQQVQTKQSEPDEDQISAAEPTDQRAEVREVKEAENDPNRPSLDARISSDTARSSEEATETTERRTRNGTIRNTDSFFKDDAVETRKITLTPNLLRDDSSASTIRTSNESKELRGRPSLDKLDNSPEKAKDDKKKKKEKKPGMLSGLFKRKDKKSKGEEDEDPDELIYGSKRSAEISRESPVSNKDSDEFTAIEKQSSNGSVQNSPSGNSKLQKQQARSVSPDTVLASQQRSRSTEPQRSAQSPATTRATTPTTAQQGPSLRMVQNESSEPVSEQRAKTPEKGQDILMRVASPETTETTKSSGTLSKILRAGSSVGSGMSRAGSSVGSGMHSMSASISDNRPEKLKKVKSREILDEFDSSPDEVADQDPMEEQQQEIPSQQSQPDRRPPIRPIPGAFPESYMESYTTVPATEPTPSHMHEERLSESPVQISPVDGSRTQPPALMVDTSSQEEPPSPVSSPSPDLGGDDDGDKKKSPSSATTSTPTSTWNDAHLRSFFDDDSEIKDLLTLVYDNSGVVPAGPDHPVTGSMFREENAKLADITNRLDGMLGDWLARKSRTHPSRSASRSAA